MQVVIFELKPKTGYFQKYLDLAMQLRPELEKIDGFISVERFQSMYTEGKILSVSFWRDEQAVKAWREHVLHRMAQAKGKEEMFEDFRIRVAEVIRDYGMTTDSSHG